MFWLAILDCWPTPVAGNGVGKTGSPQIVLKQRTFKRALSLCPHLENCLVATRQFLIRTLTPLDQGPTL